MKTTFLLFFICTLIVSTQAQQPELQSFVNQKQYTKVLEHTTNLTKSDSADYQTMYAIGQAYEGILKYNIAYNYYQHCLLLDTTRIDLLNTLARTAAYIGKSKEAETYFQQVLKQDSTDFYANYQLARLYMQADRNTEAIRYFQHLLENDPDNPILLRSIGDCHSRMDDLPNAATYYLQAFELNKENTVLASTLANLLLLIQSPEEALTICDTALHYNPSNRLIRQNKGIILFTLKEYTQADSIYSELITEGDSTYKTLKYGAISKYYAGKYMDSIEPLEWAFQKDSTSVEISLLLGSALGRTYDRKKAFALFDYAEQFMQPNPALINMMQQFRAETYARDGKLNEAAMLYYELWQSTQKMNYLDQIWQLYRISDLSKTTDEETRQRSLFISTLVANEYLKLNAGKSIQYYTRLQLQKFHEDLFFRGAQSQTLLAPDNKKSTITLKQLNELIQKLPEEMPKEEI